MDNVDKIPRIKLENFEDIFEADEKDELMVSTLDNLFKVRDYLVSNSSSSSLKMSTVEKLYEQSKELKGLIIKDSLKLKKY